MTKTVLLTTAAVLALSVGGVASAATPSLSSGHHAAKSLPPHSAAAVLYDQNNNDGGTGVTSQNFESSFDVYDNQGADDFTVPAGTTWKITEVDVTGVYYNGSGPAVSENVTFYKNNHGLPGAIVAEQDNVAGADSFGSFAISIPKTKLKGGTKGKTYFVSVQVNMDFTNGGQWGWEDRSVQSGNGAAWQNPGGGFGTSCSTWGTMESCLGFGPDLMFTLRGKS